MQERNLREPEFIDMESAFRVNLYRPAMGGQLKDKFVIEPVESKNEPVETENEPVEPENEPVETENEPVESKNEPVEPENEPVETENEPVESKNEPVEPENEPVESKNEPVEPENEPVETENEPVESKNEPVEPENEPVETENEPVLLSDSEKTILHILACYPNMTREELAKKASLSLATVKRSILSLREKGILTRIGGDRHGKWMVLHPDRTAK